MKKLILALIMLLPLSVSAEHMDVIEFEMLEGCTMGQYMEIVKSFNEWANGYGYNAKIAVALHSNNMTSHYWLGTSKDAATFGKAWDAWRDSQSDSDSEAAKLQARFSKCTKNLGRRSYDVY